VAAPTPPPAPTFSREFKVLGVDALSGLDSLAGAEMSEDLVYEPLRADAEKLVNRTKYLAENDTEKTLHPLLILYLAQIVGCRADVQIAKNKAYLGARKARALGITGPILRQIKLRGELQLLKDLEENSNKCAEEHKKMHDSIESYIVRGGPEPSQPDKAAPKSEPKTKPEEPREIEQERIPLPR